MTKVNQNNTNDTKSDTFPWDIIKSDGISFFIKKYLSISNDFLNRHFSVLWLKSTQTIEMKQNKKFFHGTYSNLTSFFIGRKVLN